MANRSLAAKHDKAKRQTIALAKVEYSKPCYLTAKPEVPAYDPAMVKRIEATPRKSKARYMAAPAKRLVHTGITVGSWDSVGTCTLIKRSK